MTLHKITPRRARSVSTSGFGLLTSAGEKVTVKETSSTTYENGTNSASASAVTKGKTALVLGTTNSTTITATQVIAQPTSSASNTSSQVVTFKRGAPSTSKTVGQIPANYKQGSGTIVSGTTANKATKAALAAYPGGIVDRVVKLSISEYEVHYIGVNWPHHIFVNQHFKVSAPISRHRRGYFSSNGSSELARDVARPAGVTSGAPDTKPATQSADAPRPEVGGRRQVQLGDRAAESPSWAETAAHPGHAGVSGLRIGGLLRFLTCSRVERTAAWHALRRASGGPQLLSESAGAEGLRNRGDRSAALLQSPTYGRPGCLRRLCYFGRTELSGALDRPDDQDDRHRPS